MFIKENHFEIKKMLFFCSGAMQNINSKTDYFLFRMEDRKNTLLLKNQRFYFMEMKWLMSISIYYNFCIFHRRTRIYQTVLNLDPFVMPVNRVWQEKQKRLRNPQKSQYAIWQRRGHTRKMNIPAGANPWKMSAPGDSNPTRDKQSRDSPLHYICTIICAAPNPLPVCSSHSMPIVVLQPVEQIGPTGCLHLPSAGAREPGAAQLILPALLLQGLFLIG